MSGYNGLASLGLQTRPISTWPGALTPALERIRSPFSADWTATVVLLERELAMLGAGDVVLELAITTGELRRDGLPRANAHPTHPGVVLSFTSKHGPLRYPCDRFDQWTANVRAIALGLEALRKVERYGIVQRGEQYQGWSQLPAPPAGFANLRDAAAFIAEQAGEPDAARKILAFPTVLARYHRAAARRLHPDMPGGDADLLGRLQAARDLIATNVPSAGGGR